MVFQTGENQPTMMKIKNTDEEDKRIYRASNPFILFIRVLNFHGFRSYYGNRWKPTFKIKNTDQEDKRIYRPPNPFILFIRVLKQIRLSSSSVFLSGNSLKARWNTECT